MRKNSTSRRKSIFEINLEEEYDDYKGNNDESMVEFIK